MDNQNYSNHRRFVPGFHFLTSLLVIAFLVLAVMNLVRVSGSEGWLYSGVMPIVAALIMGLLFWYTRRFPLVAQDRAIRAEENFRYYVLTGKQLDKSLTMGQITALRFAEDEELAALVQRAVNERLTGDDIKKAIRNWRADHHRA